MTGSVGEVKVMNREIKELIEFIDGIAAQLLTAAEQLNVLYNDGSDNDERGKNHKGSC